MKEKTTKEKKIKAKITGVQGIVRKFDKLGRLTIPVEYRNILELSKGDSVEMILSEGGIFIKPLRFVGVKPLSEYTKEELLNELERRNVEDCD